jgi:hypothetical protein
MADAQAVMHTLEKRASDVIYGEGIVEAKRPTL